MSSVVWKKDNVDPMILSLNCGYLTSLSNNVIPIDLPSFSLAPFQYFYVHWLPWNWGRACYSAADNLYIRNNVDIANLPFRAVSGLHFIALFIVPVHKKMSLFYFPIQGTVQFIHQSFAVCVTVLEKKFCLIIQASSHSVRVLYLFLLYCFHYLFM